MYCIGGLKVSVPVNFRFQIGSGVRMHTPRLLLGSWLGWPFAWVRDRVKKLGTL